MEAGTADFPNRDAAQDLPLAQRLFGVPEVTAVFLGGDFVTVTKAPDADWQVLKPAVLGAIMEHFTSGDPVMSKAAGPAMPRAMERMTKSCLRSSSCSTRGCARPWRWMAATLCFTDLKTAWCF